MANERGGSREYYLYNAHGDVVQLTNASGTVTKNYSYDAFGVEQDIDNADTNPWRYCGEYFDRETGTVYLRARYYAPRTGRFTQQDTHWNPGNMIYGDEPLQLNEYTYVPNIYAIMQSGNLYAYCMSNPVRFIDINGLYIKEQYGSYSSSFTNSIKMEDIGFGWFGNIANNGCGVIALFNAMYYHDKTTDFFAVLDSVNPLFWTGLLGADPWSVEEVLKTQYNTVNMVSATGDYGKGIQGKVDTVVVLIRWNGNVTSGAHYFTGVNASFSNGTNSFYFYNSGIVNDSTPYNLADLIKEAEAAGHTVGTFYLNQDYKVK